MMQLACSMQAVLVGLNEQLEKRGWLPQRCFLPSKEWDAPEPIMAALPRQRAEPSA